MGLTACQAPGRSSPVVMTGATITNMRHRPRLAAFMALLAIVAVCHLQAEQEAGAAERVQMSAQRNPIGRILSVSPRKGPFHGHNVVTLTGVGLTSGGINDIATISIKGVPVHRILSATANKIMVRTASMEGTEFLPGEGDVLIVSHTKGVTAGKGMYEYKRAPRIFAVEPDNGAHIGGTTLMIRGDNLCDPKSGDTKLSVEVCDQPASFIKCHGHTLAAKTAPLNVQRSAGEVCDVRVHSTVFGESVSRRAFTYRPAPVILRITPTDGRFEGGNKIRVSGSDLTSGKGRVSESVSVKIGDKASTVLDYTPSSVLVKVPKGLNKAGFVAVEVTSKRHGKAVANGMYRIHPKPAISQMNPVSGRADGGEHLTLIGTNLGRGDIERVRIGDHTATVLYADQHGRKIKVLTPKFDAADEGKVLAVTTKSQRHGRATILGFKVKTRGRIHSIKPTAGPAAGGTLITINGEHLGTEAEDFRMVQVNGVAADIVSADPKQIVVKTRKAPPGTAGAIRVYSRHHGVTETPAPMTFTFSKMPQIISLRPAMSDRTGGKLIVLQGQRLCNTACSDLHHIRIGNHRVNKFVAKSPRRIVFRAPSAAQAGGVGGKTVAVRSDTFGDAEAPDGFMYLEGGAAGVITPSDIPLKGGGNVVIETLSGGRASGMDTQILFRYNPTCRIDRVETVPGPADGQTTLIITGHRLGMGDERIYIDGKPADSALTERLRQGTNIHQLSVRSDTAEANPSEVVIKSARTGRCSWRPATSQVPQREA